MTTTPTLSRHHWRRAVALDVAGLRRKVAAVDGSNTKIAIAITQLVGSMWCAYGFGALALFGLPGAISQGVLGIVQWVAQTFLQLVLLSIIMVGQQVQSAASDARGEKTLQDTELVLDRLDTATEGGITVLHDALTRIEARLRGETTDA